LKEDDNEEGKSEKEGTPNHTKKNGSVQIDGYIEHYSKNPFI